MPATDSQTSDAAGSRPGGPVRAVVIVLALLAAVVALLVYAARSNRQEHERKANERRLSDLASIKEGRADQIMVYDAELLAMIVADSDATELATSIVFSGVDFSDKRFAEINKLNRLQNVGVYSSQNADALLEYAQGMESIQKLWIETSPVSDSGISLLATLPNLKQVRFQQVMSQEQVELLEATLPGVKVDIPYPEAEEPR